MPGDLLKFYTCNFKFYHQMAVRITQILSKLVSSVIASNENIPEIKTRYILTHTSINFYLSYWHRFKSIIPLIGQGFGKYVALMCCWWEYKLAQSPGGQFGSTHQKP